MLFEAFLPHVLPSVKGCSDPDAVDAVIKAAREFCRRTHVWNYECDPIMSAAEVPNYVFQLGEGQELVRILAVDLDGREYDVVSASAGRRLARRGCSERVAYIKGLQDIVLNPAPSADNQPIVTDVAVQPSLTSTEWPDDLADYLEDIAQGAIGFLKLDAGEDWSDPSGAMAARGRFNDRIATVAHQVTKGMGAGRVRSQIRSF